MKKKGRKVGKPRFKSESRFRTFTYSQSGFKLLHKTGKFGLLHLSKIGDIPIRLHREIVGVIKQVTIKHMPSGVWHAYVIVENVNDLSEQRTIEMAVGLDVGLTSFVVDSDNNEVENPRHLKKALKKLRREQRRLDKKKIGSKNWEKQRIEVAHHYERVCNQRNDFHHKLSRRYVNDYDLIVTENLNPANMLKNHRLAMGISDASWSSFSQKIAYKAANAGKLFIQVDPRNTTQECSGCGMLVPKSLSDRWHDCPYCGLHLSRDHNASINILQRGLLKVGQGLPEHACGHWTATSSSMVVQVGWLKQEAPLRSSSRLFEYCTKPIESLIVPRHDPSIMENL